MEEIKIVLKITSIVDTQQSIQFVNFMRRKRQEVHEPYWWPEHQFLAIRNLPGNEVPEVLSIFALAFVSDFGDGTGVW